METISSQLLSFATEYGASRKFAGCTFRGCVKANRDRKGNFQNLGNKLAYMSPLQLSLYELRRNRCVRSSALLETAASVGAAIVAVSAAAAVLAKTTKTLENIDSSSKICEDCGGSGICSECNGEGFILKKLTETTAARARMTAKNMATRYTAGLPKKWSYCSKCSSARSCSTCDGSGRVIV